MASIRRQIVIDIDPDDVWDALRDWEALHHRLAVGFVTGCRRDGTARIVTFASGAILREEILGCDEEHRRLAWSIVDGPYTHHNGAAEVFAERDGGTRLVWTTDLRPDALAEATAHAMDHGLAAIKRTLEGKPLEADQGAGPAAASVPESSARNALMAANERLSDTA